MPELLARRGCGSSPALPLGPLKPELAGQPLDNPPCLGQGGESSAICTDHLETPIQYLPLRGYGGAGGLDGVAASHHQQRRRDCGPLKRVGTPSPPGRRRGGGDPSGHPLMNGSIRPSFPTGGGSVSLGPVRMDRAQVYWRKINW